MRVLIADDKEDMVAVLEERVRMRNCDVDIAFNGEQALELIKRNTYALVFVDHDMPVVTGLELIGYIKKNHPGTRTVMVTGYAHIEASLVKHAGADEFLTKPFQLEVIDAIIEKYKK
jgi:two-component system, NtrC family, nitrogen regulation response regulator GlnG